ncbi:MAG: sodium:proton antiporter [Micrococcales bacterium]|nr:sodium:proton antiporter [Micrococcales bacterium]OJX69099.1 MAG: sodium:proton antiporter [Micrococcales bacterium 72-143]
MADEDDALAGDGRDETEAERLDRNWDEILQETRVVQTGTQILTGFLLAIAFQQRFEDLDGYQIAVYLVLVCFAVLATLLALTPVSMHRALFRRRAKKRLVATGNLLLIATLAAVLLTLSGTALLIFDMVAGHPAGFLAGGIVLVLGFAAWYLLPGLARIRMRRQR